MCFKNDLPHKLMIFDPGPVVRSATGPNPRISAFPKPRATTVVDIARHAKVSPATVSRVINQPNRVSQERVSAVHQAMQALDYTPTPMGNRRGPKSRRPSAKTIGVWYVGIQPTPRENWLQDHLVQLGASLTRCPIKVSMHYSRSNLDIPELIQNQKVDGVIIQGMEPAPQCLPQLSKLPTVWFMSRRSNDYPGDYVEPDNISNGQMAAEYLRSRGHRHTAILNTDPNYSAIAQRTKAFCDRCRHLDMTSTPVENETSDHPAYLEACPSERLVTSLVERWTSMRPRPTGIYLPSDHFCGSFLRATKQHRLEPGKDFELILGNRSPAFYRNLSHQPAAIDINLSSLVKRVIDHLIWRIDNFDSPGRVGITVSPTLRNAPTEF